MYLSPKSMWIYSEIICTDIVRKKPLLVYRDYPTVKKEYFGVYESVQFLMHSAISYTVSLKHLNLLSENDLISWYKEFNKNNYDYALDALYKFKCPNDVDSTKNLFIQLKNNEIETLKCAYSIQNTSYEECEEVKSIWKNIMDRHWCNCEDCERSKYIIND